MTKKSIWEKRWDDKAKNLAKSTSLDFFAQRAFKVLDRYVKDEHKSILEIGSGTGRFCIALAKKYPSKKIEGIDYTEESVDLSNKGAELRKLSNVKFIKADLFKLPYKDNSFDLVFENGVIEHLKNYPEAIAEMVRVTRKQGLVAVNVNNWYCFPKTIEKALLGKHYPFGYEKSFKHREMSDAFKNAGLKNIKVFAYNLFNYVVRFFFFSKVLKNAVAGVALALEALIDALTFGKFSKRFGYMTFGVGEK